MALRTRIIRLEAPSATQNVVNDMQDDIFMPATGDLGFGQTLAPQTPAATTQIPLAPTPTVTSPTVTAPTAPSAPKGNIFTRLFGTKEERDAKRERRRKNRAERKAARRLRKSTRQLKAETAAKERALKLGKSQAEAQAAADLAGAQIKALEEKAIADAEQKAKANAIANGLTPQQAEDAANAAGGLVEDKIFGGGYGTDGAKDETKFWSSMSTGAKVALIGGGVVVLGLITWGIVASNRNK